MSYCASLVIAWILQRDSKLTSGVTGSERAANPAGAECMLNPPMLFGGWCCDRRSASSCRYYADIRQTVSASDQEMNSALAELSRVSTGNESIKYHIKMSTNATVMFQNYSGELNYLVALHELYKYINKYYDQVSCSQSGQRLRWVHLPPTSDA